MTLPEWNEVIATDLTSPFLMSRAVAAGMIQRGGGKIINMCSMMSEVGRDSVTAYAAAKGGLKMLTKNLATEWAKYNIQVNGIGPGYFATAQTAPIRQNGNPFNEFIISRTPASRWGRSGGSGRNGRIPCLESVGFCERSHFVCRRWNFGFTRTGIERN